MSSKDHDVEPADVELGYTRLSPPQSTGGEAYSTIIFLHGSESCHLEFSRVATFLNHDYDVLLLDLPGHSRSRAIPFTFDNAIQGILHLIKTQVKDSKVHIVGLSLGGFIGLEFARQYPEMVISLWCTGCAPFSGYRLWLMSRSRLLSGLITLVGCISTEKLFWLSIGSNVEPIPGLREEVQKNQNMTVLKPVFDELALITMDNIAKIRGVRIAIIAGGKQDSVKDTIKAGEMLRHNNPACNAFVVKDAIHWWSLQLPEVFAQGVRAWIEGKEMPTEYEPLLTAANS